jgi:ankyrin repeat protein
MAITPLMAACAVSDKRMVDLLFEYDARPDLQWASAPIGSPRTALGFCELGSDERARQCHHAVRMYAQRREKRIETAQGRRVGSLGTSAAQRELTEMGIKQRRSPEATEEQLTITLEVAIEMDDVAYVSKWLREGGRDSVGTRWCIGNNFTPLDLACFYGSYNVAQRLLKARADANEPDNMHNNGWFPLLLAATSGSVACVEVLLDFGADCKRMSAQFGLKADEHADAVGMVECARAIRVRDKRVER